MKRCDPPCKPRPMLGMSWWKNLGFNSPCDCAEYYAAKGFQYMSEVNQDISKVIIDEWSKDEKINALIENDIKSIEDSLLLGDKEFLWAVLSGDGWVPYNQLTDEQIDVSYEEMEQFKHTEE